MRERERERERIRLEGDCGPEGGNWDIYYSGPNIYRTRHGDTVATWLLRSKGKSHGGAEVMAKQPRDRSVGACWLTKTA